MSDINENININVEAKYESLNNLISRLDETKKLLGSMSKARINFDIKKDIQKSTDPIMKASQYFETALKNVKNAQNALVKSMIEGNSAKIEKAKIQLENAESFARNVIKTIEHTPAIKTEGAKITDAYKLSEEQERINNTKNVWKTVGKNISNVGKQMAILGKTTKKSSSSFSKLIGRIRNISIYRAIRTGLKWITSGFQEGMQNFVQYDKSANQTLSNINGSLQQIRNTMGIALTSVLQSLEPLITKLADSLVDMINSFNLAMAKMKGEDSYQKAKKSVDDYAKSLKKAKKLSFDTFEVLSGDSKTSPTNMFEPSEVEEDENRMSQFFERMIELISLVGQKIQEMVSKLFESGFFEKALGIIEKIAAAIADILISLIDSGALDTILDVVTMIWDIFAGIIQSVANFIVYLNEVGALKPILLGIAAAFVAIKIAALAAAIANAAAWIAAHPITGGIALAAGVATLATIGGLMANHINKSYVGTYANGGIPAKSELFYMNENGNPEALINTGGSQTNVINIDQLSEGMRRGFIQAVYDVGLLDAIRSSGSSELIIDKDVLGRNVAESSGFRNEITRRNTGNPAFMFGYVR